MTPNQPASEAKRTTDILHARKKLCFKIGEAIADHIDYGRLNRDAEGFSQVVDMHLPITHVEADAYMDEQREAWKRADNEPAEIKAKSDARK